jgi:peptidoglycan/LPS O-acetylase OafA/YrhL
VPNELKKPGERFVFIDGLRALAAIGVMTHHLYNGEMQGTLYATLPRAATWVFGQDLQRVEVFFVISGFVIAWSLRSIVVTASSAFNFILRRQIRLDPAYWLLVIIATLHLVIQAHHHPAMWAALPTPKTIFLNMIYLQKILHLQEIMPVAWSLCMEVQLYLLYIILLWIIQRSITRFRLKARGASAAHVLVILPPLFLSLWLHRHHWAVPYALRSWYLFAMGILVCWAMEGRVRPVVLLLIGLLELFWAVYRNDHKVIFCVGIAGLIYVSTLGTGLTRWLRQGIFQYLGRISYSLFLVHWDVGKAVLRAGVHITHYQRGFAVFWFILACAASIGAAHLLNVFVEQPSIRLASRLKPRSQKPIAPAAVPLPGVVKLEG